MNMQVSFDPLFGENYEKKLKETDKIDDVIELRTGANSFYLSPHFKPKMSRKEEADASRRCEAIQAELNSRGFVVTLSPHLPLKALYLYLQYISLITEGLKLPDKHFIFLNGCGGWCEKCFQQRWCYEDEPED